MDVHRSEVQTITASEIVIDFVNEIQRIQVATTHGNAFQLQFRGQQTGAIQVGTSTLQDLKDALEALVSVGDVIVTSNGEAVIETGEVLDVEFLSEHGSLDLIIGTGSDVITKLRTGEAPYRSERQSIRYDASGGYVVLSFNGNTATIDFDDDMLTVAAKLSALVSSALSITEVDVSISTVCDPSGKHFFVDFRGAWRRCGRRSQS